MEFHLHSADADGAVSQEAVAGFATVAWLDPLHSWRLNGIQIDGHLQTAGSMADLSRQEHHARGAGRNYHLAAP